MGVHSHAVSMQHDALIATLESWILYPGDNLEYKVMPPPLHWV